MSYNKNFWWGRILDIEDQISNESLYSNRYKHLNRILDSYLDEYNKAEESDTDMILERCFNSSEIMNIMYDIYKEKSEKFIKRKLKKLIITTQIKNILLKDK